MPHPTDKGEHTALCKVNNNAYINNLKNIHYIVIAYISNPKNINYIVIAYINNLKNINYLVIIP